MRRERLPEPAPTPRRGDIFLLGLGHAVDDFYPSFLSSLLPLFVEELQLSLALAGALATIHGFSTSLIQPLFGYLSDRVQRPTLLAWGILGSAIFTSLWGLAPNGLLLTLLIVLAGLGAALFHPVAGALAGRMARERKGLGMSVFVTGGTVGYGLGPLVAVGLASRWGLPSIAVAGVPGVLTALLLYRFTRRLSSRESLRAPTDREAPLTELPHPPGPGFGAVWRQVRPLLTLVAVVTLRAALAITLSTFLPLYLSQRGLSLLLGGLAVSVFRIAGAVGGIAGGPLSDHIGRKATLFLSFILALPLLWGFFLSDGWSALALLAAAGAIIGSSMPVNILLAQEAAPQNPSLASGMVMGLAWGLGGLVVTGVGWWGDQVGLFTALSVTVMVAAAMAGGTTLFLREAPARDGPRRP